VYRKSCPKFSFFFSLARIEISKMPFTHEMLVKDKFIKFLLQITWKVAFLNDLWSVQLIVTGLTITSPSQLSQVEYYSQVFCRWKCLLTRLSHLNVLGWVPRFQVTSRLKCISFYVRSSLPIGLLMHVGSIATPFVDWHARTEDSHEIYIYIYIYT